MDATESVEKSTLRLLLDDVAVSYRVFPHGRLVPRRAQQVEAVRGVSLEISAGESVGIIGRNGAGKSSLLRAMAGLLPLTRGAVYASSPPVLLGVGKTLVPRLSGRENIELGCLALGMTRAAVRERIDEIIDFSGVADHIELPLSTYSSGMAARLKFAIASSVDHEILLLDEALVTGDLDFKERSMDRMRQLRDRAEAVVLVSHSMSAIRGSCTRVVWIEKGRIEGDGKPDEVIDAYSEESRRRRRDRRQGHRGPDQGPDQGSDP
jgi:teichoic acid transport system ATP-binding protein